MLCGEEVYELRRGQHRFLGAMNNQKKIKKSKKKLHVLLLRFKTVESIILEVFRVLQN
jgi:hypothetical protein